ncbi:MAG: HEAT repeat domain-containing protein [Myxococcaceae bacterium]
MLNVLATLVGLTLGQADTWDTVEARYGCRANEKPGICATRLKAMLAKELAKPKLTLAMPSFGCDAEDRHTRCSVSLDGCMPVTGLLVISLEKLGKAAAVAMPEIKQAGARSREVWMPSVDAQLAAGATDLSPTAVQLLEDPDAECRWRGASMLGAIGTPEAVARLTTFVHSGPWADREHAVKALTRPDSIPLLTTLLTEQQPIRVTIEAARSLGRLRSAAQPAAPTLEKLAREHWSQQVRTAAAKALETIVAHPTTPARRACSGRDAGVPLVAIDRKSPSGCAATNEFVPFALEIDGQCVTAKAMGEFGGGLSVDGKPFFEEWHQNPYGLIDVNGRHYLVQGLRHMFSSGELDEVIHDAKGWRVEFVTDLPGAPQAMRLDAKGALLLLTDDADNEDCGAALVRYEAGARTFTFVQ